LKQLRHLISIGVGATLAIFALQNLQPTQVRIFFWYVELPLVVILLVGVIAGAAAVGTWAFFRNRRRAQDDFPPDEPST